MIKDGFGAIRVSFSILSAWEAGDIDRAVAPYIGEESEPTEAMKFGSKMHAIWEAEGKETKCLPKIFGGRKLIEPRFESQTKKLRRLTPWCSVSGVLDVKDLGTGIDFKTGVKSASEYANGRQHEVYQVLYPELKRFEYHCYNQTADKVTMSVIYLDADSLRVGIEWILKNAAELRSYLIANGYGDKLDQGKGV